VSLVTTEKILKELGVTFVLTHQV